MLLQQAAISSSFVSRNGRELLLEVFTEQSFAPVSTSLGRQQLKRPISITFFAHKATKNARALRLPNEFEFDSLKKLEQRLKRTRSDADAHVDYGGLHVYAPPLSLSHLHRSNASLSLSYIPRKIPKNAYDLYELERNATLAKFDAQQPKLRPKFRNDEDITGPVVCRRNNWQSKIFPVCNNFHESTLDRDFDRSNTGGDVLQEYSIHFRGHGYFRDSWLLERPDKHGTRNANTKTTGQSKNSNSSNDISSSFVWKSMRLKDYFDYDYDMMYQIHREAIIMERLTASERIVDIYGHCGTSIFAENMEEDVTPAIVPGDGYMRQKDLNRLEKTDVHPMNNLTAMEKLDMALVMAESLADIHGYKGGVISHGDTHPDQWLRSRNGKVKLNDFNNAEIFDFNEAENRYCKIFRCFGGTFRSPEEFRCIRANEAMDTYSMGNNIYSLLTGLWPFYNFSEDDEAKVQGLMIDQKLRPLVDPRYRSRSLIESELVAIMEECWEWEPDRRISIFEVVRRLRELKAKL